MGPNHGEYCNLRRRTGVWDSFEASVFLRSTQVHAVMDVLMIHAAATVGCEVRPWFVTIDGLGLHVRCLGLGGDWRRQSYNVGRRVRHSEAQIEPIFIF